MLASAGFANILPPIDNPFYTQTSGRNANINRGDWYSVGASNGIGNGYHFYRLYVPDGWPSTSPISIDIQSPEMTTDQGTGFEPWDEIVGTAQDTTFAVFSNPTTIDPHNPTNATPGTLVPGSLKTYVPSNNSPGLWVRHFTITSPVPGSEYLIRSDATTNEGENSYRLRIGYDDDTDPNNAAPSNSDNWDGIDGTDDELKLAFHTSSFQQTQGTDQCTTFYTFIPVGEPSIQFDNFEMDNKRRVRYYAPSDTYDPDALTGGIVGTVSGDAEWNGGTMTTRGGDTITSPEAGWWRIVNCLSTKNQFIQEGTSTFALFMSPPRKPTMTLEKTANVTQVGPNATIVYTIAFANTASGSTAGAAKNLVFTDTLDSETTFVSGTINGSYTGSVSHSAGVVTVTINEAVFAGDSGTVTITATANNPLSGDTLVNNVSLSYEDSLKNVYPPLTDNNIIDVDVNLAKLGSLQTTVLADGTVLIDWTTLEEFETLAFDVYAVSPDGAKVLGSKLTPSPIPATAVPGSGAAYSFHDETPLAVDEIRSYAIMEIEMSGNNRLLGITEQVGRKTSVSDWMVF